MGISSSGLESKLHVQDAAAAAGDSGRNNVMIDTVAIMVI
jgi:hypothetical protein